MAFVARQIVGGQDAGGTRIAQDGQSVAPRPGLQGQCLGDIKKLGDRIYPDDTRTAKRGIIYRVVSSQAARVGEGCLASFLAPTGFQDDNRFISGKSAGRAHKATGIHQAFHINEDTGRLRVGTEVIYQVGEIHVHHRTNGDEVAEPHAMGYRPVQDRGEQRAALRDQRQVAGQRHARGKTGIQPLAGQEEAQAVRAEQAHAVLAAKGRNALVVDFPLLAFFQKARRDDQYPRNSSLPARFDHIGDAVGRDDDDGQVHFFRYPVDVGIGWAALHGVAVQVHREELSVEPALQQICKKRVADPVFAVGGPDDGDRRRVEDFFQLPAHSQNFQYFCKLPIVACKYISYVSHTRMPDCVRASGCGFSAWCMPAKNE